MNPRRARAALFAAACLASVGVGCADLVPPPAHAPVAVDGAIDLTSWDFERDGPLTLDGTWDFFWRALPEEPGLVARPATARAPMPGKWNNLKGDDGAPLPKRGFGTYRLRVLLPSPETNAPLAFAKSHADSAYRLLVDEGDGAPRPLLQSGIVGTDIESELLEQRYDIEQLPSSAREVTVLLGVSNFHYPRDDGGSSLRVGTVEQLRVRRDAQRARDHFLVGFIFVVGIYHLALFVLRRSEKAPLYFGLFCIVMAVRTLERGRHLEELFAPARLHGLPLHVEYLGFYLAVPLFALYVDDLIGRSMHRLAKRAFVAIFLMLSAVVVLTPPHIFELTVETAEVAVVACIAWIIYELARAIRRTKDRMLWVVLLGFLVLGTAVTLDILSILNVISTPILTPAGQAVFIVAQAVVIASSNARARRTAEDLSKELMRLSKLKDEFLANTSHELRTPLHGVIGLGQALLDGVKGPLTASQSEDLSLIVLSAKRLSSLINDILDFEKIKNQELSLRISAVDAHSVADVVVAFSRPLLRPGVELVLDVAEDLPLVAADEARLQQIMFNLVGNAVKFTHAGEIRVSARVEGSSMVVAVSDTGIGIPAERHAEVFKPFEQADGSTERMYGGTGLGLSITKRLVELHGGEMRLASTPGKGSTFSFTVPLSTRQDAAPEAEAEAEADGGLAVILPRMPLPAPLAPVTPLTSTASSTDDKASADGSSVILIVDDEPVNVRVLQSYLSQTGYDVRSANSGPEALALVDGGLRPDLVLLDVMMPRMSGYSVCGKLRARWPAHVVPIVLVTAKGQTGDIVEGFTAGANDYLLKPVTRAELLARIQTHLQLAKMSSAAGRFVPFEFLEMLNKQSLVDVQRGDHTQKELSILFSDIRSFTTMIEGMTPSASFAFVNEYLERMEVPIRAQSGFIDSYIGDAIMALFDGPADAAVMAGIGKLRALDAYNEARAQRGVPALRIGIGVNTGPLMLGTIGGATRINCGVIGDAVNLAARIEGMTKMYGASLLVSEHTFERLADPDAYAHRVVDRVRAKGRASAVTVYEILDGSPVDVREQKLATLATFRTAVERYGARDAKGALELFSECARKAPSDLAAALYVDRCRDLLASGYPPGWDGVIELTSK